MNRHITAVGWLWIVNGAVSILMVIIGLIIANLNIPAQEDALVTTIGVLCCFVPGIVADFAAGYGLLRYKTWARILVIILAILNLILLPIGTVIGIYTLWVMFKDETKALLEAGG